MRLNDIAKILYTVGDDSRLKILCFMFDHKHVCVSHIARALHMNVAIVSHHLNVLARKGIVIPVREGKHVCYIISTAPIINDIQTFICKYKK